MQKYNPRHKKFVKRNNKPMKNSKLTLFFLHYKYEYDKASKTRNTIGAYLYPKKYNFIVDGRTANIIKKNLTKAPTVVTIYAQNPSRHEFKLNNTMVFQLTDASAQDEKEYKKIYIGKINSGKHKGMNFRPRVRSANEFELSAMTDYIKKLQGKK